MRSRRLILAGLLATALVIGSGAQAWASARATQLSPETRICGQIKHGPFAKGAFPLDGKIVTGTTWTVFADGGASCSFAMAKTRVLLKQWAKAKPGALKPGLTGWICSRAGSIIGECFKPGKEIDFWMTGKYTLAQLKAFKVLGH